MPHRARHARDDFTWVVDDTVIAMSHPSDRELSALVACGVTHIISLTVHPPSAERMAAQELTHIHIPFPDMSAPSMGMMTQFVDTLSALVSKGRKVAVHCGAGLGRTGTMLACYLVSTGLSAERAISEVRLRRPGSVESYAQEHAVGDYEAHLAR